MILGKIQRLRPPGCTPARMKTKVNLFQQSHYWTFNANSIEYLQRHLRELGFPHRFALLALPN
jgi:hypothetical protein